MILKAVTGRRVALLALAAFVVASDATLVAALLRQIASTLSASPAGQAVTVYAAGYAVGAPLIRLVRRARQQRLLTGALGVLAAANAATAAAPSLAAVLGARIAAAGCGGAFMATAAVAGAASRAAVLLPAADSPESRPGPMLSPGCTAWTPRTAGSVNPAPPAGGRGQSGQGTGPAAGMSLELLDPDDDDELMFVIEARHEECQHAPDRGQDMIAGGEPVSPGLHVVMHHAVARQILAGGPPQTWQSVQRLAGLGYDRHHLMDMIASLAAEEVHGALAEHRDPGPAGDASRLDQRPGDRPPPGPPR
jgi:hypothetical protein